MREPGGIERGITYALRGEAMVQKVREFVDRNAAVRSRLAKARGELRTATEHDPTDRLPAVVEELEVHQEELSVAEEELQAQVDELARVGKALLSERTKYRDLFESAPDAYLVTDLRGAVLDANEKATRLFGTALRFLRRKPLAAMVLPEHVPALRDVLSKLGEAPDAVIELPFRRRDGGPLWAELTAHVSRDSQRVRWLARDVSARKMFTEQLAHDRDEREARVAERTAELERALRDKDDLLARERSLREQLQTANAAKDRFLAVLSHDLRGPLNAVLGWTSLLRREHFDTKTRDKALATIERNARAQNDLIEELLDVSRIGAGKMQLDMRVTDFGDVVRKGIDAILPVAVEKKIDVLDRTTPAPVLVLGDAARLRQVVANLLTNALKFTPAGGRVTVELTTNGTTCLRVLDTGKGISAKVLPDVFDCFKQSGDSTTAKQGLGLGLFIVRHIVEMHGGSVSASSEGEGKGAELTVTLPTRDAATAAPVPGPAESVSQLVAANADDAVLDGLRVLLVDDEADARELLATALQRRGAIVMTACDAATALETFDAFGPDVVVSDVGLPDRSGNELVAAIRKTTAGADVPALAVSGFASRADARQSLRAGFDAHVRKPFVANDLFRAIADVIRMKNG